MGISLQVLAYNVSRTINVMLRNAAPHVDKIYLAYPERAWEYNKSYRHSKNPTRLDEIDRNIPCELQIVRGGWKRDEETRNALLNEARKDGFDWIIIQDADEFYTEESWERLTALLISTTTNNADYIEVPYFTFWKSPSFILEGHEEGLKNGTTVFAINCKKKDLYFSYSRTTTGSSKIYVDEPCYHYSYVLDDRELKEKLASWTHSGDLISKTLWYNLKWKRWNSGTTMLHPGSPWLWKRAIRFPLPQPSFAEELYIQEPVQKDLGIIWSGIDLIYNLLANGRYILNGLKRILRSSLHRR